MFGYLCNTSNNGGINMYPELDTAIQFRIDKINKTREYFFAEICERETMSKILAKYISAFDYVDKTLLVLFATSDSVSIASIGAVIGAPVRITSAEVLI